jgi:ABC-type nitrate/sulfonate/bicarbonate transport system permease component
LFSGLRIAIAFSVIGAVIGEWVGSSEGLGYLMIRSKPQFLTERVFAAIFILSALGVSLFAMVLLLSGSRCPGGTRNTAVEPDARTGLTFEIKATQEREY